jgi:hypothetical protein
MRKPNEETPLAVRFSTRRGHPENSPVSLEDEKFGRGSQQLRKILETSPLSALNAISIFTFGFQTTDTFFGLLLVNSPVSQTQGKWLLHFFSTPDHESRLYAPPSPYKAASSPLFYRSHLSL